MSLTFKELESQVPAEIQSRLEMAAQMAINPQDLTGVLLAGDRRQTMIGVLLSQLAEVSTKNPLDPRIEDIFSNLIRLGYQPER